MKRDFRKAAGSSLDQFPAVARAGNAPDLHTQLEDLFDEVWRGEADWKFNDRIDLAMRSRKD